MDLATKMEKFAVLLTSHPKQQMFWEAAFLSWVGYKGYIMLVYDDIDIKLIELFVNKWKNKLNLEAVASGYKAGHLGHLRGELMLMKIGGKLLAEKGFLYFFKSAADTACYRYYNLPKMIERCGKHDFFRTGTAIIFGKVEALNRVMEPYHMHFRCGSAESYFKQMGIQIGIDEIGERNKGWWESILGRVHIQGEYAIGTGMGIRGTWKIGEIWPRSDDI